MDQGPGATGRVDVEGWGRRGVVSFACLSREELIEQLPPGFEEVARHGCSAFQGSAPNLWSAVESEFRLFTSSRDQTYAALRSEWNQLTTLGAGAAALGLAQAMSARLNVSAAVIEPLALCQMLLATEKR